MRQAETVVVDFGSTSDVVLSSTIVERIISGALTLASGAALGWTADLTWRICCFVSG